MLSKFHVFLVICNSSFNRFYCFDNSCSYFIRISRRIRTTIFQVTFPALCNTLRNTNRSATVRNTIGEIIDAGCFMFTGQDADDCRLHILQYVLLSTGRKASHTLSKMALLPAFLNKPLEKLACIPLPFQSRVQEVYNAS